MISKTKTIDVKGQVQFDWIGQFIASRKVFEAAKMRANAEKTEGRQ